MTYSIFIYDKYNRFEKFTLEEEDKTALVWRMGDESVQTIHLRNDFDDQIIYNKRAISKISIKEIHDATPS